MIDTKSVLAVIPARGGSKGVPGKNIRVAGGKPLIAWTIEAARSARRVGRTIVSTDDGGIAEVARLYGADVPFMRDAHLAGDTTPTIDVVLDAIERCPGFEWVVLLQPTSPLRTPGDIDAAIDLCATSGAQSCVSVTAAKESPYWMFTLEGQNRLKPLFPDVRASRRQDLPEVYVLNGAIYVAQAEWLRRERRFYDEDTAACIMPGDRSIDIDTESDFLELCLQMEKREHVSLSSPPRV